LVPAVVDLVPTGVEELSEGQAIFQKLADHVNHVKPLHVKGFINGKLVNNMLVDNGTTVNLMTYSLYKKLGGSDEELIKTKRMVKGIGGEKHIPNKRFVLMELYRREQNIGHCLHRCRGAWSYNWIPWRDWIHAN